LNRRNLNAYDRYQKFYDDIAPTVFNFIGIKINKDFNLDKLVMFRIYGGLNYQTITNKYLGEKISSQINPNIGGSLIWKFSTKLSLIVDAEVIKIVNQSKDDEVSQFIENGNYIDGDLGEYQFDGHPTNSLNVGLVFTIKQK
jgi:hypothetical protein